MGSPFHFGHSVCGFWRAGDGESGRLGLCGRRDSERQESVWIRCRSRVRTTSDGESSIDMEPLTLSLDNYESGGRSVHDDIRDCLAGYAKLPTPTPTPMAPCPCPCLPPRNTPTTTTTVPTMCGIEGRLGRRRRPATSTSTSKQATSKHQHRTGLRAQADGICRARRKAAEAEAGDERAQSEKSESVLRNAANGLVSCWQVL